MITFYILAIIGCNVIEGQAMVHSIDTDMTAGTQYNTVQSTDALGGVTTFWTMGASTLGVIGKVVTFDYTIFKDVDRVTGATVANDFAIFRYLLIAIGIVLVIEIIIMLRSISK
jgi:hypothetical protein